MWKKYLQIVLFVILLGIVIYVEGNHLLSHRLNTVNKKFVADCLKNGTDTRIDIKNDQFVPNILTAKVCDRLIITNLDSHYHLVAFGDHEDHLIYPGFNEKSIPPHSQNVGILKAVGSYQIHDHLNDDIKGEIIVEK